MSFRREKYRLPHSILVYSPYLSTIVLGCNLSKGTNRLKKAYISVNALTPDSNFGVPRPVRPTLCRIYLSCFDDALVTGSNIVRMSLRMFTHDISSVNGGRRQPCMMPWTLNTTSSFESFEFVLWIKCHVHNEDCITINLSDQLRVLKNTLSDIECSTNCKPTFVISDNCKPEDALSSVSLVRAMALFANLSAFNVFQHAVNSRTSFFPVIMLIHL